MAYGGFEDASGPVMRILPADARELYRLASQRASDTYADPEVRPGSSSREEYAHHVAWTLVNLLYERDEDGNWRERTPAHEVIAPSDGNTRWIAVA